MNATLGQEIVSHLSIARDCWWTARRLGAALQQAVGEVENVVHEIDQVLETSFQQGMLRRKRGVGGQYEYQLLPPELA